MKRYSALIFLTLAGISTSQAIVGGLESEHEVRRHTVLLSSRAQDCSGTLIARDLIITAAHCVVSGGSFSLIANGVSIPILTIVVHPQYRRDSYETHKPSPDIAILKLARPAPSHLHPARLAIDKSFPPRGTMFIIAGFGEASEGDRRIGTLRSVQLLNVGTTGGIMLRLSSAENSRIAGSCTGDSGGSAFRNLNNALILYGVIAWAGGRQGRNCGLVTGIVLVANQLEWIRTTARSLGSPID
jgi:secreted trypsin-like serine protease